MKIKKIQLVCFLLIITIIFLSFSACGDRKSNQEPSGYYQNTSSDLESSKEDMSKKDDSSQTEYPYSYIVSPTIVLSQVAANPGDSVIVQFYIMNNPGIAAATFKIHYDRNILKLDNVNFNEEFGGEFDSPGTLNTPVSICWSSMKNIDGSDLLLTLQFTVRDDAVSGNCALVSVEYLRGDFCNLNEDDVMFDTVDGKVIVK